MMAHEETEKKEYLLNKNDYFIKKTASKFIVNSIISVMFVYASSLIDTVIVGMFLGEKGLSAMSLVSPIYLIFYTVGATIGIGGSILASRALGSGDLLQYKKIYTLATFTLIISAVVMVAVSYIFFDGISNLLCGNITGERKEMFKDYFRFYIPGGAATLMSYVPLYFLKTDGRPKVSSRLFTLSAVMNIVLTLLFMCPLVDMGIGGASLATSISMATVSALGFIILPRNKSELQFVKKPFSFALLKNMVVSGIPNGITNLLSSARIMLVNYLLIVSGVSALLSCYTIVRNVTDILSSVILGISSAIIPLVGVLYGERDYESNKSVMKYALRIGCIIMAALVLIVSLMPDLLFRAFSVTDPKIIREGRFAIPLSCIGLIAGYINTLNIGYLTAIKREKFATLLVVLRLFALLAAFAYPLSLLLSSKGIWLSFSLAEIATLLVYYLIVFIIRKKNPKIDKYLVDADKIHEGDITFSVKNDVNDIVFATEKIGIFCEDNDIDMKKSMKISLAIEELLTFLNSHLLDKNANYTDVRVSKLDNEVMVRFRYLGKMFDPKTFYLDNELNDEMQEELLGLKMIMKTAAFVNHTQMLGANNLMIIF